MNDHLLKLASLGSEGLFSPPYELEYQKLASAGSNAVELWELLGLKNGFYAFESALHVFPVGSKAGVMDLNSWNSDDSWRADFGDLADGCFFFAEDIFGMQFCCKDASIQTFDPETGATQKFAEDLGSWARLILEDYNLHTGYPLAHDWQLEHGPLKQGLRLVPKMPFVLGGAFALSNLWACDSVEGMRFRASIAVQIKDLPDGASIKLNVSTD